MSRSDEEGFHPHPGDPWHPGWDDEVQDDGDPSGPESRRTDPPVADRPKRRGRFGRRSSPAASEPAPADDFAASEEDLPEPTGWEAYDDSLIAADLESVVSPGVPTWTDEGGSSVEFESAFTVGGEVGPDDTGEQDAPAAPEAGSDSRPAEESPTDVTGEDPTSLIDEIVLPDLPDLSRVERPGGSDAEDPLRRLDVLLPTPGESPVTEESSVLDDLLAAAAAVPEGESPDDGVDDGILEIPAEAGVADLTRAAEDAAAALRTRAAAMRREQALEIVAGELDAVEIDAVPEPPLPPADTMQGLQGSLLSAGLDLPEVDTPPADPGYTPESVEADADGIAGSVESAPPQHYFYGESRRAAVDPDEIVSVGDVDAALSALAAEPIAAADPDALEALRAIDEDDDVGDWEAFAGGGQASYPPPAEVAEPEGLLDDLEPPLVPSISADDLLADPTTGAAPVKRGLFGRRKPPKETGAPSTIDAGDGWTAEAGPGGESGAAEGIGVDGAGESAEDLVEGWEPPPDEASLSDEAEPAGDGWDDDIGGIEEADAFFGAEDQSGRPRFGSRRGSEAAGEAIEPSGPPAADLAGAAPPGVGEEADRPGPETARSAEGHRTPGPPASDAVEGPREPVPGSDPAEGFEPRLAPPVPPASAPWNPGAEAQMIQPLSEMPLLDEGDDRLEVTPIGSAVDDEFGEWQGDGSRIPASWFADVDEDEVEIEDLQPVDADEAVPVLEAGGMFDVGDIMDPLPDPVSDAGDTDEQPGPMPGRSGRDEPGYEPPPAPVEPPDLFESAAGPAGYPEEDEAPDVLGEAAALMSGESPVLAEPPLWSDTVEIDSPHVPEPPPLPGAGAEAWDAPPLVPSAGQPWEADTDPAGFGTSYPEPPIDLGAEVYDVVEDDLDRAPVPEPPSIDPSGPLDWSGDLYTTAATMEHRGLAEAVARASTEDTQLQALSAAMPGLASGVVGFEDVEDLGTDEIYIAPPRSDLGARILTGLILVSLLFGSLWVGGGMLAAFVGVMMMIGLTEYFTTLRHKGYSPLVIFGYLGAIGALGGAWAWGPIAVPGAILVTTVVVFFFYAFAARRRDALVNGGLTVMGMAWITGTVAFAMPIIASEDYRVLVFALVAATVAMDVGAYGFGRAWGSAQMAPVLSPNKSIEGLAGGTVVAIGVAIGIGLLMDPFDLRSGAALGLVVAVAAPLGDLAESMLKRSLGVKDMGAILPGHGGILDRVDAFLFVIPPVWVLYELLGYLS